MERRRGARVTRLSAHLLSVFATVVFVVVLAGSGQAGAQDGQDPTSSDEDALELAERFAPFISIRPQDGPCDTSGEEFTPADVDIVLDNPHMLLRQVGPDNPVVLQGPTAADIFDMGGGFFIDFPGDAFDPGCLYEQDFDRYNEGRDSTVYAHIATQADAPGQLAVQYWFFYYYNRYNNLHEGDWEGIQLLFDVGTVEEALEAEPVSVGYSQHFGGEVALWDDDKLDRQDDRVVAYPATGSHASYFEPALFLGRSGSQGFGCDSTVEATTQLDPTVVLLPDRVDSPDDPLAWMMFEWLWGEQRFGPFSGASGPITKPRWDRPVEWHETLRSSSVTIPDGVETTAPFVSGFCTAVSTGSGLYLAAIQNPALTAVVLALLGLVLWFLVTRTEWNFVTPFPIVKDRRLGEIMMSAARLYYERRWTLGAVGLMYVPLVAITTLATAAISELTRGLGWAGTALTAAVSGILSVFFVTIVAAAVMHILKSLQDDETTNDLGALDGYRYARDNIGVIWGAAIRATIVVVGLAVTIVGIPWAIRQYIRYQVAVATIVLEGQTAEGSLERSSELIHGRRRWWHTAVVIFSIQSLLAATGAVSGILFLILANGLPLGAYSAITAASGALIVPYLVTTSAYLYGNIIAEQQSPPAVALQQ